MAARGPGRSRSAPAQAGEPLRLTAGPARRTPLHAAAFADNVSGLRMLLQHEAEVDATDHTGRTALMTAAENGQTAAVGAFPEGALPGSPHTGPPACRVSHPLDVRHKGCRQEVSRDGGCSGGVSLLCLLSLVEFLLYRGKADLTVLDENKNTALHLACSKVPPAAVVVRLHGAGRDEGAGA